MGILPLSTTRERRGGGEKEGKKESSARQGDRSAEKRPELPLLPAPWAPSKSRRAAVRGEEEGSPLEELSPIQSLRPPVEEPEAARASGPPCHRPS
jgi:hypothetical protein